MGAILSRWRMHPTISLYFVPPSRVFERQRRRKCSADRSIVAVPPIGGMSTAPFIRLHCSHLGRSRSGTIIVGREIDYRAVHDMGRTSAGELALSYDRILVASTLGAIEEQAAGKKLQNASSPGQIEIGDDQFFADTLELNKGPGPIARLTVLKSYSEATAFLTRLNHLLLGVGVLAVLVGAGFVFLISESLTSPLANLPRIPGTRARRLHLSNEPPWRR